MSSLVFGNLGWLGVLLPLLAVPIMIHLLNRRFPQIFRFSSLRFIRESMAQRSRLFRFRHLILVMLRTLAIMLLLMVFLKPLLDSFGGQQQKEGQRCVIIILDHSLSMGYLGGAMSSRQRGLVELEKLIDSLEGHDLANLILAERQPRSCFEAPSTEHREIIAFARSQGEGLTRADMNGAIAMANAFLRRHDGPAEIHIISDFQRQNWADARFDALPATARLFFIDVGARVKANRAILAARMTQGTILAGEQVPVEVSVGNYADSAFEAELEVVIDQRSSYRQFIQLTPWSVGRFTVMVAAGSAGLHTGHVSLPGDDLRQDDSHWFTYKVLDKEEVVLLTDVAGNRLAGAWYLKAALNPFGADGGSLVARGVTTAELSAIHLAATSKVFISGIQPLTEEASGVVAEYIRQGGNVVYFLDGLHDADNLAKLDRAFGGGAMPLALTSRQSAKNLAGGVQRIMSGDFRSRYLSLFRGGLQQQLAAMEFYEFYYAIPTGVGQVILHYADETPAMAANGIQLGSILLCNFSASEVSSTLARQRIFPAWIQELVKSLGSGEQMYATCSVGEMIATELWKSEIRGRGFRSPDGLQLVTHDEARGDDRLAISFVAAQPGIYGLSDDIRLLYAFAVNVPPEEADLRSLNLKELIDRKGGVEAYSLTGSDDYRHVQAGRPIFHLFLLALLVVLLAETIFYKMIRELSH